MKVRVSREIIVALTAVVLGLAAGALFMLITGHNPFEGYTYLFRGGLMNVERIGNSLATATPLIMTGLSVAFAFRTGLFNIGASGQMLIGGLCATAVGLTLVLPQPLLLALMLLAAVCGGALWGLGPRLPQGQVQRPRGSSHHHDGTGSPTGRSTIRSRPILKDPTLRPNPARFRSSPR